MRAVVTPKTMTTWLKASWMTIMAMIRIITEAEQRPAAAFGQLATALHAAEHSPPFLNQNRHGDRPAEP